MLDTLFLASIRTHIKMDSPSDHKLNGLSDGGKLETTEAPDICSRQPQTMRQSEEESSKYVDGGKSIRFCADDMKKKFEKNQLSVVVG